ncbi:transcriptional regulator [Lactiplantibacillus plantarum]|nr:transcriptional regulator [Lactiplantibacillus plantarum]MCK8449392.1 transcriptional regulator [Lactiplantibacillus plantarum]MDO7794345.1 transcriptional regulator [Lactiplantibacillus plantarum]
MSSLSNSASIGATVKMVQHAKGLSVNDVTNNERIISKSTYYRFINGHSNISVVCFLQLLERLELTLQEFDFILHHYQIPPVEQLLQQIQNAVAKEDIGELWKLKKQIDKLFNATHAHRYQQLLTLTHLALHHLETPQQALDSTLRAALDGLIQDLLNLQLWSKYDLMLCRQIFTTLTPEQQIILLTSANKSFHKYQRLTDEALTFMTFLANQLFVAVHDKQPKLITKIYPIMTTINFPSDQLVPALLLKFCQGITDYVTKPNQPLTACRQALDIVHCLHIQYWDTIFQNVLLDLKTMPI